MGQHKYAINLHLKRLCASQTTAATTTDQENMFFDPLSSYIYRYFSKLKPFKLALISGHSTHSTQQDIKRQFIANFVSIYFIMNSFITQENCAQPQKRALMISGTHNTNKFISHWPNLCKYQVINKLSRNHTNHTIRHIYFFLLLCSHTFFCLYFSVFDKQQYPAKCYVYVWCTILTHKQVTFFPHYHFF